MADSPVSPTVASASPTTMSRIRTRTGAAGMATRTTVGRIGFSPCSIPGSERPSRRIGLDNFLGEVHEHPDGGQGRLVLAGGGREDQTNDPVTGSCPAC